MKNSSTIFEIINTDKLLRTRSSNQDKKLGKYCMIFLFYVY